MVIKLRCCECGCKKEQPDSLFTAYTGLMKRHLMNILYNLNTLMCRNMVSGTIIERIYREQCMENPMLEVIKSKCTYVL